MSLERGAMLTVPAGGFSEDVDVSISTVEARLIPLQPTGSVRVGSTYQIEAVGAGDGNGASAAPVRPVIMNLPYDPTQLPVEHEEEQLVAVFWDGEGWVEVGTTVDVNRNVVVATPSHLSMWTVEARDSRFAAALEIGDGNTLYAGDPINLRLSARTLLGDEPPVAELFITARYRDPVTGSTLATEGRLPLTESIELESHRLDLFPRSGTLGDRLLTVHERDQLNGDGFFNLVIESGQVHESVESIAVSARVGAGLTKVETDLANMSFPLPLPPMADLAITGFELTDVDFQPVDMESLEQAQEVLFAIAYANFGGLLVSDARIELRDENRLLQETDLVMPLGLRAVHTFRVRLGEGEQRYTTLIRSVGQVADSNPADNQMGITLTSAAAVHQLNGRVVNDLGLGMDDAVLTLSGGGSIQINAQADGRFSFPGLRNGVYTLFPSHPDFQFPPVSVDINGADLALATIVARPLRYAIAGRVVDDRGLGVTEIVVRLSGDALATTMTDTAGHYRFENLPSGSYGIHPAQDDYAVTPGEAKLLLVDSFNGIDFVAVSRASEDPIDGPDSEPGVAPDPDDPGAEPPPDEPGDDPDSDPGDEPVVDPPEDTGTDEPADADDEPTDPGVVFVDLPGGAQMEMVFVEAGSYTMGSSEFEPGRSADEGPQHPVEITDGFYLGRFEIKESEWVSVMERPSGALDRDGPAVFVSWNDVQDFIDRANQWVGEQRFRLPTEAEWEYAARGGTETRYSFGENPADLVDYGWYRETNDGEGAGFARPVGRKGANPFGLFDMHGNVWEWVHDWYWSDYYDFSAETDPTGPASGSGRVVRGGVIDIPILVVGLEATRIQETLVADLPGGATMDFVWIEPGAFTMGAPESEGGFDNESPQHLVDISRGFYIGRTEVTQEQWELVRGTRPWLLKDGVEIGPDYPASHVDWIDVQDFILGINEDVGESIYRLPTEAEWEYAARAGSSSPWFFGEDESQLSTYAWFGSSVATPQPVGLKQPNAWGLHDVHGNVWEWVQDWFGEEYYAQSPISDPSGPATGSRRVMRGGDYRISARGMRVARRFSASPSTDLNIFGFRLVLARGIPELQVSPEEFTVVGRPFESVLQLRNVGSGNLEWSVSEQAPWLVVGADGADTGTSGFISGTGDVDLVVSTSGIGLDEGIWQGAIQLNTNGGERTVLVTMRVRNAIVVPLPGGATMEFVWIDAGRFQMGSPEVETGRYFDEGPLREVEITEGFYLGRFEINQGQWISAMGTRPWLGQDLVLEDPAHPATYVSWDDLQNLIQTLNDFEGETLYRLPTEAEWEFAARAGTQTRWSFGNDASDLDDYAWYHRNSFDLARFAPAVGTRLPNPWELYDMHGNVWEWVEDFYAADYYEYGELIDPQGPEDGTGRVIRGGAFFDLPRDLRAARRPGYMSQRGFGPGVGGRLVRIR